VRLERRATGLSKPSVANSYDIQKVLRADFVERVRRLDAEPMAALEEGLRLVLDLQ
jgi:mRNA-degrading endonuclease toxin of MazEF toxin-antitoxin module